MERVLAGMRAAADPTRLRLLSLLSRAELTVSELTQILGQSQPRISRHLKLMCEAGLLNRFQEGSWVFYRMADRGEGARLARFVGDTLKADDPTLARDLERLEGVRAARTEQASQYFREQAAKWHEIRALHIPEADVEAAMIEAIGAGSVGEVIDLGTGTGRVLEVLAPRAVRAVGVDMSREMLSIARARLDKPEFRHVQVRYGDLFNLDVEPGSFDLAVVHLVLHYLNDPAAAVFEAARLLKPGGRLLVVDFAPHDLEFLRESHAHRRLGFTPEEVAGWCRAAGLTVTATRKLPPRTANGRGELTVVLWLAEKGLEAQGFRGRAKAEQGSV
ncbi:ArsR/SmtB family transcription factor [Futiania mangrovi]|uniref:Metalloregulator ArsR/SmtB family transcription factor n=1 Tax=Futiania mangrovi TaxID=2959716 RepID=A0A9J6PE74_9PROT|nr:metalloregulator ArsR/SmtB family transcription factor [Futiania mangrovii]MCP1336128.1 metalloregulator ArsR/SmtB family transcription factor [Futiania mangrovii]